MKKLLSFLVITALCLTAAFGLAQQEIEPFAVPEYDAAQGIPVIDRSGREIEVPEKTEKIISMAPSATSLLVDLGAADRIIATDTYSVGIEGLPAELPAFDMMAPDAEMMLSLEPDIVIVSGMSVVGDSDPFKQLVDAGICIAYVPSPSSIEEIMLDNQFIGDIIGLGNEARAINIAMADSINQFMLLNDGQNRTVYFEISPVPYLYTFGSGTFLNEMIELLGGVNIFADQESWIGVSEEQVVSLDPDIIFTNIDYVEDPVGEIMSREGWGDVAAVAGGQVYLISANYSSQPNNGIIIAMEEMARAMYPEEFN